MTSSSSSESGSSSTAAAAVSSTAATTAPRLGDDDASTEAGLYRAAITEKDESKFEGLCRKLVEAALDRLSFGNREARVLYGALIANGPKIVLSHYSAAAPCLSKTETEDLDRELVTEAFRGHARACATCGSTDQVRYRMMWTTTLFIGYAMVHCPDHELEVESKLFQIVNCVATCVAPVKTKVASTPSTPLVSEEHCYRAALHEFDITKCLAILQGLHKAAADRRAKCDTSCPLVIASGTTNVFRHDVHMLRDTALLRAYARNVVGSLALRQLRVRYTLRCILCGRGEDDVGVGMQYTKDLHAYYGLSACPLHADIADAMMRRTSRAIVASTPASVAAATATAGATGPAVVCC